MEWFIRYDAYEHDIKLHVYQGKDNYWWFEASNFYDDNVIAQNDDGYATPDAAKAAAEAWLAAWREKLIEEAE